MSCILCFTAGIAHITHSHCFGHISMGKSIYHMIQASKISV